MPQCRDKTDEQNCNILVLEEGYNKMVPPITMARGITFTIVPVNVHISIDLKKIVDIEEVAHKIKFQFRIKMNWYDNRARFLNLKVRSSMNSLTEESFSKLWLPLIIYDNTDQKQTTRLGWITEWSTHVAISRESNFTRSGNDETDEIETFRGSENSLTMIQTYTI